MSVRSFIPDRHPRDLFFTPDFSAEELRSRRERIAAQIGADAHLLIAGAPPVPNDFPTQDALFYYFCGLETVHSYLLIEGGTGRTRLFLPSRDTVAGEPQNRLGFEDAALICDRLKIEEVGPTTALTGALTGVKVLYFPHAEVEGGGATRFSANGCAQRRAAEPWDAAEPRVARLTRLLQERVPGIEIRDAVPLINEMRTIKSPAEIAVLRQAGQLAARACIEGMKASRPGMTENELQAIAEYVFRRHGHCGLGYGVIAAGGKRTWDGHYHYNNATLRADEIVLMDCGPDLRHYSSDIARLWPVNGVFSPWHRQVYGFIVDYHKTLISLIKPGALVADIYAESERRMAKVAAERNLMPIFESMLQKKVGYINHAVGLSVHDAVDKSWREQPLREGFVAVIDPMVWCDDRHEYIRVEDTFVVTATGCERLTGDAPFEIADIERLLREARK
jgi:Xaa-Pro aminopeptidase